MERLNTPWDRLVGKGPPPIGEASTVRCCEAAALLARALQR